MRKEEEILKDMDKIVMGLGENGQYAYLDPDFQLLFDEWQVLKKFKKDLAILKEIESKQNGGRGVQCVKSIISYCDMGMIEDAKWIYQWDSDKLSQYPELEKHLYEMFGCPLHFQKECNLWPCKRKE
jgi:hypothetical protein